MHVLISIEMVYVSESTYRLYAIFRKRMDLHDKFLNRCEREQEGLGYEFISLLSDNPKQILTEMQGQ